MTLTTNIIQSIRPSISFGSTESDVSRSSISSDRTITSSPSMDSPRCIDSFDDSLSSECSSETACRSLIASIIRYDGTLLNPPAHVRSFDMKKNVYSWDEIRRHCTSSSCWLVVKGKVYDCTSFISLHPGGEKSIVRYAGTDATEHYLFHSCSARKMWKQFQIGVLEGYTSPSVCSIM